MAAGDLTTKAEVRKYLNLSSGQTDLDTLIDALITQASVQIKRYCGREFAPQTSSTARKFRYYGGGYLHFSPYDLDATTAPTVQIDTDEASPTTLTVNEDYYLLPINADDGVYTCMELRGIRVASRSSRHDYSPSRQFTITGVWGFDSVPSDVALAANIQVGWLLRTHSTMPSHELSDDTDRSPNPRALGPGVPGLLNHWKVTGFGGR